MTSLRPGPSPIRPATPGADRRAVALALALVAGLFLVPARAFATVTAATYNQELNQNNGHDVPAGQRNLPGGQITVTCDNSPSEVTLHNQLGTAAGGEVGQFGAACGVATNTPNPATTTRLLFEGRTQIITTVVDQDGPPEFLGPQNLVLGTNAGEPIFFDADTGPPDHAILDTTPATAFQSTNPNIVRDFANNRVVFNAAAVTAGPLDLQIQGRVLNIPAVGAPLGEVGATVAVTIQRVGGGSIAPETTPRTTFTGPYLIPYTADPLPTPAPDNPAFAGVANEEGAFRIGFNWTNVQDGTYILQFFTRDVQGAQNPNDGQNLVVTVVIDRTFPGLVTLNPPSPFIANGVAPDPFCEDVVYTLTGLVSDPLGLPSTVTVQIFENDPGPVNPIVVSQTVTTTLPFDGFWSVPVDLTTAPVVPGNPGQIMFVSQVDAIDSAGNPGGTTFHVTIWDQAPTVTPTFSSPASPFATRGNVVTFTGAVANVLPGTEVLEEHGTVDFILTIFPAANPSARTTFVAGGTPSLATHDSQLDVITGVPFPVVTADNILGVVPDQFTFSQPIDVTPFPDGDYRVELQTIDQACNRSPVTTFVLRVGRQGPVVAIDLVNTGPDDNYDHPDFVPNRPPNQFGADDPVLIISLRSPERPDPGLPIPLPIPVPFPAPPNDFDPGTQDLLTVAGTVSDVATDVVQLRAGGPNIPTTTIVFSPGAPVIPFSLVGLDLTNLGEGIPELLNLVGTSSIGVEGPTTSLIIVRDVVPARRPILRAPVDPFFTNRDTLDIDGEAEPNAVVALLLPATTGVPVAPMPRTTNGDAVNPPRIPNPRSLFNSIPSFAVTTRARPDGTFSFRGVSLANVVTSLTTPTVLLLQAIDLFDNTDPVLSVEPLTIFRTTGTGNAVRVVIDDLDPDRIEVFPVAPTVPPTSGQFRGLETVDIRIDYDTFVVLPPSLTVTQNAGAPPVTAGLLLPADTSNLSTQTLVFRYQVLNRINDFDGPVTLAFTGGRDVFGTNLNPLNVANAFFVDSVAPVLVTTASPTQPAEAQRVPDLQPLLQADLVDAPATVTTTASGLSTAFSSIQLFGPLEINPDSAIAVLPTTPTGAFDIAFRPALPLPQEGTYRMVIVAVDNVGNSRRITRTFVLDRTGLPKSAIDHDPDCGSFVNVLPRVGGQEAILARILDPTVDLALSTLVVVNSNGDTVVTSRAVVPDRTLAAIPVPPFARDGRDDGLYSALVDLVDLAGNPSPQVTCSFVFDTTPPSVAISFPATATCVNDPLRVVQVTVADPPSPLSTSVFSAGMDLAATRMTVRMQVPAFPSTIATGTFIPSQLSYRTLPGTTIEAALVEFVDAQGAVRALAPDGSEDGVYLIEALVVDRAGNSRTHRSTFGYDTQEPDVVVTDLPDPSSLAGAAFRIAGTALDQGCCGFALPATVLTTLASDTVSVRVVRRDAQGRPVLPPQAPFFDFQPAAQVTRLTTGLAPGIVDRAAWTFAGTVPNAPGAPALLQVRVRDRAGNFRVIDRRIDIQPGGLVPPVQLLPPAAAFVDEKVLTFRWTQVAVARRYELELTRATPTALTTATTFTIDYPRDTLRVDLPLFAGTVPGGAPIAAASTFSWRIRALDAVGNAGPFSPARAFTVDPDAPGVADVLVGGVSLGSGGTLTGTTNALTLVFSDDTGMDPARLPEVVLQPRDPAHPPLRIPVAFTGGLTAAGSLVLPVPGVAADPNGPATLVVRGAFDLAGNPLPETRFTVPVDIGPFIDLRLAPNPVANLELLFAFVTRGFEGGPPESVAFSAGTTPSPLVQARQQGRTRFETVAVGVVEGTTPAASAFHGRYRISPNLIGFVDFTVEATDLDGRRSRRNLAVAAAPEALLKEGIVFPSVVRHAALVVGKGALKAGSVVYGLESRVAGGSRPLPGELEPVLELGAFLPQDGILAAPVTVSSALPAEVTTRFAGGELGLYRADPGGWTWLPATRNGGRIEAGTTRLGHFALMADRKPPVIAVAKTEDAVAVSDGGSGVDPGGIVFVLPDGREVRGRYDAAQGTATLDPDAAVGAVGRTRLAVKARDRAGNTRIQEVSLQLAGPLAITELVPTPNPVRVGPARIRYRLSQAATAATLEIYDPAGGRVAVLAGPTAAGVHTVDWDLRARGRAAANGVYFVRLTVRRPGEQVRADTKLAVLR